MTVTNRVAREAYEKEVTADTRTGAAIDEAFDAVKDSLAGHGFKTANDDAAENLVTAIYIFLAESNGWVIQ